MKKFTIVLFLMMGLLGFSQNPTSEAGAEGTTEKEFIYISKGYKEDSESGRDIIKGYRIEEISSNTTQTIEDNNKKVKRVTTVYRLIRENTKETAAFILEEYREDTKHKKVFCLPNPNASTDIWQRSRDIYLENVSLNKCSNNGASFAYNWNMLMIFSKLMTNQ